MPFEKREHAEGLLRHLLPAELCARLNFQSLKAEATSFVDERLKNLYADLLYSVELEGHRALIYILLEHLSSDAPWVPSRILG